jgi:hypothetical protein
VVRGSRGVGGDCGGNELISPSIPSDPPVRFFPLVVSRLGVMDASFAARMCLFFSRV